MNKNLLLLSFFALAFAGKSTAQIQLDYDTVTTAVVHGEFESLGHNHFTNNLPQVKTFRWVRHVIAMTTGWTSAVCDKNNCYTVGVDSMNVQLGPFASSLLDVHLYPNEIYDGSALIELLIKDINNPSNNVTAVYIFDSSLTPAHEAQRLDFKIFPNPSSGLFTMTSTEDKAAGMEVYSLSGQLLSRFSVQEGNWYDIAALQAGTYLIRLEDDRGLMLGMKMMTKL